MSPKKNRSKHKNTAPPPTQTEEQTVVAKPSTENHAPPQNPPSGDSKSEGQMSVVHVTCVSDYYMILLEDGPHLYPPDFIVLQTE